VGPLVISKQGELGSDNLPVGIDREFFSLLTIFNENLSLYFKNNTKLCQFCDKRLDGALFEESNLKHTINGLLWADNTGYTIKKGEKVRWYVMALGTETDLHTPHWHGVTFLHGGHRVDVTELMPASTKVLDMVADNPGEWMFHCHVNDHLSAGMSTNVVIE
jgi:hypothetical protein